MPYPGLRPFEAEDAPLFFGREAQVNALLRQLEDHRFVAVVGSSGSGKSSLVRAGLLPAVGEGFLLGTTDWRVLLMRPGQSPYQGLARVLSEDTRPHGDTPVAPAGEATATPGEAKNRRGTPIHRSWVAPGPSRHDHRARLQGHGGGGPVRGALRLSPNRAQSVKRSSRATRRRVLSGCYSGHAPIPKAGSGSCSPCDRTSSEIARPSWVYRRP